MKNILLLHGAIGTKEQFKALRPLLEERLCVHAIDLPGHGDNRVKDFGIPGFAADVHQYIEEHQLHTAAIFGYSMGGYVAVYLASRDHDIKGPLITLGTKFHWDTAAAKKEAGKLDPEKILLKVPAFAEKLKELHGEQGWKQLLQQTAGMMHEVANDNLLNTEAFERINNKVLLMLGEFDNVVTQEETLTVSKKIPNASLLIHPGTGHPFESADPALIAREILRFIDA